MNINEWFGSIEPSIRDNESLLVVSDIGLPVIGKTPFDERVLASGIATVVNLMRKFESIDIKHIICEGDDGTRIIVLDCEPYIILAVGERFTLDYLKKLKIDLLQS